MTKLNKSITRILKFLGTGSFTLLLAACYGVMNLVEDEEIQRKYYITIKNDADEPIPGLELTLRKNNYPNDFLGFTTATDMSYSIQCDLTNPLSNTYDLRIEDVDGINNGGYYGTTVVPLPVNPNDNSPVTLDDVILTELP